MNIHAVMSSDDDNSLVQPNQFRNRVFGQERDREQENLGSALYVKGFVNKPRGTPEGVWPVFVSKEFVNRRGPGGALFMLFIQDASLSPA